MQKAFYSKVDFLAALGLWMKAIAVILWRRAVQRSAGQRSAAQSNSLPGKKLKEIEQKDKQTIHASLKLFSRNAKRTVVAAFVGFEAALEKRRKEVKDGRLLPAI